MLGEFEERGCKLVAVCVDSRKQDGWMLCLLAASAVRL